MSSVKTVASAITVIIGFAALIAAGTGASIAPSSSVLTTPASVPTQTILPTAATLPTVPFLATLPTTLPSKISLQDSAVSVKPTPNVSLEPIQPSIILSEIQQENQGWNNCGPASLKMVLGYYGRDDTQQEIAAFAKPDSYDVNVSADELVAYARKIGMAGMTRENGATDILKAFLSNGLPVIIETGMTQYGDGWIAHDKVLIGYDDKQFIFMDPLASPNQKVSFDAMDAEWQALNRRYVVVYPSAMEPTVRAILGSEVNDATMYTNAVTRARAEIAANPQNAFAYFNLGTNLNGLQQYQDAAAAFDRARAIGLPWRMMWYQFGPYVAYLSAGRNNDVIALANATLAYADNLEESHYYKGMALNALGQAGAARYEFQSALLYNKNYLGAQRALRRLSTPD